MKKETLFFVIALAVIFVTAVSVSVLTQKAREAVGSVAYANEYQSTSTPATSIATSKPVLLKTGSGSLGSVVITGAGAGSLLFYDATTTDKTKRTGQTATSTVSLASFPVSAAAGTYTFDVVFDDGLTVELVGTSPTTTITWR